MACEEATFSRQHSAVSENENQKAFTAKDAEDAKENKQNQHQHQRPFTTEGTEDTEKVNADEQEQVKKQAEGLALRLAQTYEELTRLLERNPGVKRQITEGEAREEKVYQKLKQRLKLADMAPRCQWVRQDGTSCRSPQMKQHIYCFAHMQMAEARELMLRLPAPEDANAIQVGLMRIQKAVIEDTISMKKAGLLLYSMQLALTNVGQTTFGQAKDEEMVRETVDEEEAFREKQHPPRRHGGTEEDKGLRRMDADVRGLQSAISQDGNLFTTEGTEEIGKSGHREIGTSENQNLPRMDADVRGLQGESSRESEFVPVLGGYGFERVRLRMNPSGHQAISPQPAQERRGPGTPASGSSDHQEIGTPPRAAVPHEHAQVHANLG